MICPKCKTAYDGNFCPNCGKINPAKAKWYQRNSPATVGIMVAAFIFLAVCVWVFVNA